MSLRLEEAIENKKREAIEHQKKLETIEKVEQIKKEDPAETATRRNRIRLGTATAEDFAKEGIEVEQEKQAEIDRFSKLLEKQSEIAENTKNTLFWVRFWSILSLIGYSIGIIALAITCS